MNLREVILIASLSCSEPSPLHFASYTPDIGSYQQYKRGIEKYSNWFDPPLDIKDGPITVPQGPSVGIKDIRDLLKDAKPVV